MTSAIDVTVPIYGNPTTKSVRDNFHVAHDEIGALQTDVTTRVKKSGDTMQGFLELYRDPEIDMQAATKRYVDSKSGGASLTVADSPPAIANGKMWFDSIGTQLYIGYDDGSSAQWVVANNTGANSFMTVADSPPTLTQGALWFDSVKTQLYVGFDDGNTKQWVIATNPNVQQSSAALQPLYNNVGRNLIHNGMFNIQQRSGPFTVTGNTVDRWALGVTTDTVSVNRSVVTDGMRSQVNDEAMRFCLTNTFTGNAAAAANNCIEQRIEDVRRLAGKTVTLSFYASVSATQKIGINAFQIFGTGGSPSAFVQVLATGNAIQASGTWTRYSTTIVMPSIAGKTLGTNNDDATYIRFFYSSGANNNQVAGNIGVQSGVVQIWGVQLEIGSVATPLEKLDAAQELANCQRYLYIYSGNISHAGYAQGVGSNLFQQFWFPTSMRVPPTLTGQTFSGATNISTNGFQNQTREKIEFYTTAAAAGGVSVLITGFTLSAEI